MLTPDRHFAGQSKTTARKPCSAHPSPAPPVFRLKLLETHLRTAATRLWKPLRLSWVVHPVSPSNSSMAECTVPAVPRKSRKDRKNGEGRTNLHSSSGGTARVELDSEACRVEHARGHCWVTMMMEVEWTGCESAERRRSGRRRNDSSGWRSRTKVLPILPGIQAPAPPQHRRHKNSCRLNHQRHLPLSQSLPPSTQRNYRQRQ